MSRCLDVAIIGPNEITREGLRRILVEGNFNILAATISSTTLIANIPANGPSPTLIVIDEGASVDIVDCCGELRTAFPEARLVLMSNDHSVDAITVAMCAGVHGYLAKQIGCEPLVGALQLVAMGEKVVPSQTVSALTEKPWRVVGGDWFKHSNDVHLSDREREILRCLTRGDANKLISRELSITEATVKVHIKAILRKLNVLNRTQAAMWAVAHNITEMPPPTAAPSAPVGLMSRRHNVSELRRPESVSAYR